jgi:aminocarboxymuconate-semialdehyde decarboxylase
MGDPKASLPGAPLGRRDFIKAGAGAMTIAGLSARETAAQTPIEPWSTPQHATSGPTSIDLHVHWAPETYIKAVTELGRTGAGDPLNFDMARRIKWMDARGVKMQVLTLNGGMPWQWTSPDQGAHIAQLVNDAGVAAHAAFPERFVAGIELPVTDPIIALKELNRVAGKPGLRAVHLPNSVAGRDYLFEPAYIPLLGRCEELGYPLIFHPLDGEPNYYGGKERLADHFSDEAYLSNTLGFPFETATTAAKFIVSGTLDKFPKLEIVLPHSGGCFPYVAGRVDHGLVVRKFKLQRPFMEYVRRFHYDTLTYYPDTLRFLINLVGSDRVVIGTDNSFGATLALEYPNTLIDQLNLPAVDHDRILRGNASRLLHL